MKKTRLLLMLACSLFVVTAQAKTYQVGVALANFDLNFVSILRSQMARNRLRSSCKASSSMPKAMSPCRCNRWTI